jgi:glucosamine--fructose-6-phosphate aminotransferase (isomerizing)
MCGIVAYTGRQDSAPILLEGLRRLEYRGYDSAGIAVIGTRGLAVVKRTGVVSELAAALPKRFKGVTGIGHTRWATHGPPSDVNAHPHVDATGRIALVHNGILENAAALRAKLEADGVEFASETDTEVLAHLVGRLVASGVDLAAAVRQALELVVGAYGIAVVDAEQPGTVVAARQGSPIVLGLGEKEMFVASDVGAFVRHTRQIVHLDDGDLVVVRPDGYEITSTDARSRTREALTVPSDEGSYDIDGHPTFMHKEIHEQPRVVEQALLGRLDERFATAHLGGLELDARAVREIARVHILGCGSAGYAGEAGAQLIESLSRLPARAESASEFRYRNPVVEPDTLYVAVSQSGRRPTPSPPCRSSAARAGGSSGSSTSSAAPSP